MHDLLWAAIVDVKKNSYRLAAIFLAFGVFLYGAIFFAASNGDAFQNARQEIYKSNKLNSDFGKIETINLDPFKTYNEKTSGSEKSVVMFVKVTGAKKKSTLEVHAKKSDLKWTFDVFDDKGNHLPW